MKKKNALSMFTLIVLVTISLVACSSPKSSETKVASTSEPVKNVTSTPKAEVAAPVNINLGIGFAVEENLWFMQFADDSVVPNRGKYYNLKMTQFRANTDRLNAYQAGQLDGGTIGQVALMLAAQQNVPIRGVAVVAKDTPGEGLNSLFMALKSSGITSVKDLKGKVIGISDFKSPTDFWARSALRTAGLDPDKDVKWVVVPIPSMLESVRSKKIDIGMFTEPFRTMALEKGEFVEIFNSKTGVPFDEDFLTLFMNPDFIKKNEKAVKYFLSDYISATKYYKEHKNEVKQLLLDKKFVQSDPAIYLKALDSNRSSDGKLNKDKWEKMMNMVLAEKWLQKPVDLNVLLDNSYLPQ